MRYFDFYQFNKSCQFNKLMNQKFPTTLQIVGNKFKKHRRERHKGEERKLAVKYRSRYRRSKRKGWVPLSQDAMFFCSTVEQERKPWREERCVSKPDSLQNFVKRYAQRNLTEEQRRQCVDPEVILVGS